MFVGLEVFVMVLMVLMLAMVRTLEIGSERGVD